METSPIDNIWRERKYKKVKKDRGEYFVTYSPINLKSGNHALLTLTITGNINKRKIAIKMEEEVVDCLNTYPIPIVCMAVDDKDDYINFTDVKGSSRIVGYMENGSIFFEWRGEFPNIVVTDQELKEFYKGLNFETRNQLKKKADDYEKDMKRIGRFLNFTTIAWAFVAITIAVIEWQHPLVGIAAFIYAIYKVLRKIIRRKGFKTEKEKKEAEIKRKKEHYFYHCELNPAGFRRLRAENFENEQKERTLQEHDSIKNQDEKVNR